MGVIIHNISNDDSFPGIKIFETNLVKMNSAVTLPGIGIFIHYHIKGITHDRMLQHEYGHYLDYLYNFKNTKRFFPLIQFYLKAGFPSLLNTITGIGGDHRHFRTETRANKLAKQYYNNYLASGFEHHYPIT